MLHYRIVENVAIILTDWADSFIHSLPPPWRAFYPAFAYLFVWNVSGEGSHR